MDGMANDPNPSDFLEPELSDEDLELAAAGGRHAFPTFTCGPPSCATGGGCGTWSGIGPDAC
jgi:hypothetical protein